MASHTVVEDGFSVIDYSVGGTTGPGDN